MSFSGWVAYAVTAVVSAVGDNKLMPAPDCACKIINGQTGYVRDNSSWIIGRILRDYDSWMDNGQQKGPVRTHLESMITEQWENDKIKAEKKNPGSSKDVKRRAQTGLCVSIYKAQPARPGYPGYDLVYFIGYATIVVQLGIAAIPCGLFGDWGILLVTAGGIILSLITGSLPQWAKEKWACRHNTHKTVILSRGNGNQHAIMIIGDGHGIDLEDLSASPSNASISSSYTTRFTVVGLAICWILLLITAAGLKQNTWFLLAVGALGMLQNIFVAGWRRFPKSFGVPLKYEGVIGMPSVMDTLFAVEKAYPRAGRSMRDTFFPGKLRANEDKEWDELERIAEALEKSSADQ